jgi:anti-sigma regulatory factor (Ser/Thr protein kinase)
VTDVEEITFSAPAQMETIADLRDRWTLGDLPDDGCKVIIDVRHWQRITPTPLIGILCATARLAGQGHVFSVTLPQETYARRMLETVGFRQSLETFAKMKFNYEPPSKVRRLLPIIEVQNFRTSHDVQEMTNRLEEQFSSSEKLTSTLLQDAVIGLGEASENVVQHSLSPVGGFALAQVREKQRWGKRRRYIEIAVGDPGVGIRGTLTSEDPSDRGAIAYAMEEGSTGVEDDPHRGYGLFEIRSVATSSPSRRVTIHSGHGVVESGMGYDLSEQVDAFFPGTLLTISIPVG